MPHLQYPGADGVTVRFPLLRRLTTIGASKDCDLVLAAAEPTHCTVEHEAGNYKIQSTSRSAVFYVGGKKLREHTLRHGDVFVVGGVELAFAAIDPPISATTDPESASKLQIEAMRQLQRFSELLLREESSLEGLLSELIDQVVSLTGASKGFLVLADGDKYDVRVARGLDRQPVDEPEQLLSDKIIRAVIDSREPQIISDAYNDTRFQSSMSVINLKLSSVMCVPLIVRGELLGLIYVGNNSVVNLFRLSQLETLRVYAAQAALFIKNAKLVNELRSESAGLQKRVDNLKFGQIIGACPQMIDVYKRVEKVAGTDISVLVTGETGTGKELIAQEIHSRSQQAKGPLVTVNCGAIPENLIESELFGHVKGAFTGAVANQIGKFQAADKGTIFLDEVGELPLQLQVKFLRVLQEHQVQRVGETRTFPVDVRVVAATNRDLAKEVAAGRFREDLYHRLNVIDIRLPPLRERGQDVLLIAKYFVSRYAREYSAKVDAARPFDASAERALLRFNWPGNIRQLENHIKKALVLADGPSLTARDLDLEIEMPGSAGTPVAISTPEQILPLVEARELWQRDYINHVLALNSGNRTKTARDLGVDPRTIFRHLEKEDKIVKPRLLAAATLIVACILPDRDIDVVNEDIQNKQAVRIVEPIELTEDAALACEAAAKEADMLAESCPQPGIKALPHFLDPRIGLYDFCACDPQERHKSLNESTLYVEDRDDDRKDGLDSIYAALQLDLDPTSPNPHQFVRYTDFVNPRVELSEDRNFTYRPVKRPDPHVRQLKIGNSEQPLDLCNDVGELNQPLAPGFHTVRLIVSDRFWFTDPDGNVQDGVPDLASGASYDTRVYVFHCTGKTAPPGASQAEIDKAERCQDECVQEDGV